MADEQIKQSDINNAAWDACDTFRGVVDASNYKDYILVMLFLKYISDVWRDHRDKYNRKYKGNDERIRRKLARERFILSDGDDFYDLYDKRNESNIGEQINIALEAIEDKNKLKLGGVFRDIDFNSEPNLGQIKDRNRRLKDLLENFHKLDMHPSRVSEDVIGNTYIYLIERFASDAGKKSGEFYTPQKISELVAKLCGPKAGAEICDPTCGSGGLLIEAANVVGGNDYALYGMEINGSTWALCRMNMFLHSIDSARIEWCNTLVDPALVGDENLMKFDNIVANPPFSLKWGAEEAENDRYKRFWRGIPPKSKGDYAFISHMIESAKEKQGRIAVVVPHAVLHRNKGGEGHIRRKIIEDNLLDAVIGLPINLFPQTSMPVAVLVFDRSREKGGQNEKRKKVLFIDASREYQPGKNQNILLEKHINKILSTYKSYRKSKKYAYLAHPKEIKENGYNLNIPCYVDTFKGETEIDIATVEGEIKKLERDLARVRRRVTKLRPKLITQRLKDDCKWERIMLGNFLKETKERHGTNDYPVVSIGKYGLRNREEIYSKKLSNDYTKNKVVRNSQIVFGLANTAIVFGVNVSDNIYSVSPAYKTFQITDINPTFLDCALTVYNGLLSQRYLITSARQGKAIDFEGFMKYKLSVPDMASQERIADILNTVQKEMDILKQLSEKYSVQKRGLMQKFLIGEWEIGCE